MSIVRQSDDVGVVDEPVVTLRQVQFDNYSLILNE